MNTLPFLRKQFVKKMQGIYHSDARVWIRVWRWVLFLGLITLIALFSFSAGSQPTRDQLESAVQERDWDRATLLIDQLLQEQPQNRQALEAYKDQVLQLQQQDQQTESARSAPGSLIQPVEYQLPGGMARIRYDESVGDYLSNIDALLPGGSYLRWTKYPVSIYIQSDNEAWFDLVKVAVDLWKPYIPLNQTGTPSSADITIERMPNQGVVAGIAKSTDFYKDTDDTLQHRVAITIGEFPSGGPLQVSAVATHELGHALGLWGHSDSSNDIMSPTLTSLRSEITDRDLNTVRRIYEQPTLIGTQVPDAFYDFYSAR